MQKYNGFSKMWFLVLLLVAVVAGCASNAHEISIIPDTIRPTVSFTSPASADVAVPTNRKVNVAFSEAMDPVAISTASFVLKETDSGTNVPGAVTPVATSATFTPTIFLKTNTKYTATIKGGIFGGVKDLAGNRMASDFVVTFTTGLVAALDTIAPTVSVTSPTSTAVAVPTNRKVTIGFSEVMDPLTITTASFMVAGPGGTPVTGTITSVNTSAIFAPVGILAAGTKYTATITTGVKDLAGNAMASNYVFDFTTDPAAVLDTIAPTVSVISPTNTAVAVPIGRKVFVGFSEAMDPLTITNATFTLSNPSGALIQGTVFAVGTSATFTPAISLVSNTVYTGTITTGVKDLAGNAMASPFVYTFTTSAAPDTIAPTLSVISPTDTAVAVPIGRKVSVGFSEAMDPLTITNATFTLSSPGVPIVPGQVFAVGTSATFTPAGNLAANTKYTATITTGVKDLAGNALAGNPATPLVASNFVSTFTTGIAADVTAPTVILVNPADLAIGVSINSSIDAMFNEAMDPATISTASFTMKETVSGNNVPGTVTPVGTSAVTFAPSNPLAPSTKYTATIKGGIGGVTDLAGNAMASNFVFTFTTAAAGIVIIPTPGPAGPGVNLGTAATYGIIATDKITLTVGVPPPHIYGDIALTGPTSTSSSLIGFSLAGALPNQTSAFVTGSQANNLNSINTTDNGNSASLPQLQLDLASAYNNNKLGSLTRVAPAVAPTPTGNGGTFAPGPIDLSGLVLRPGIYAVGTATDTYGLGGNGPLVLDAQGNADAVFVFQADTMTTTTGSVVLQNGAQAKNVFWVLTNNATIGTNTFFQGTIVAGLTITVNLNTNLEGRMLAGATGAGAITNSGVITVPK